MDNDLRISLWNSIKLSYLRFHDNSIIEESNALTYLLRMMWSDFFKWPIDTIEYRWRNNVEIIRKEFFNFQWFKVYDFLNFLANLDLSKWYRELDKELIESSNKYLERELSAFRFVGHRITLLTSKTEIEAIETALQSPCGSVNQHLETALDLLSDRENPDYRNSMKESISAVEAISRKIGEDPNNTLGRLLNHLEEEEGLHPKLNKGFTALYHYTSDADGIRHGLTEDSTVGYEDAIYFLVTCSAFVNYLNAKYGE